MLEKAKHINQLFNKRRTYRKFKKQDIDIEIIKNCLMAASSAPSGANQQGYSFCVIQSDEYKKQIRELSEKTELNFYNNEKLENWHQDLSKLKTNYKKEFLTDASYLIVIFYHKQNKDKSTVYYPLHGVGLATGMLISALHQVGINTITYTPLPMDFLKTLLNRKNYEIPYMILACGIKDEEYNLPDIKRKSYEDLVDIF